ncbi:MAG: penicillin-binding transpeptidase domain-containing protein [bacterium]|nr:penicillin-binding transpeptidase domain-containing protein [bacterium]
MVVAPAALARDFSALDRALQAEMRTTGPGALVLIDAKTARRVYEFADPRLRGRNLFTPGSLAKPWSAAVLLKHAAELDYAPERNFRCAGRFYPTGTIAPVSGDRRVLHFRKDAAGREYLPCSKPKGHGRVGLTEALAQSCNAYFLTAAGRHPRRFYELLLSEWAFSAPRSHAMQAVSADGLPGDGGGSAASVGPWGRSPLPVLQRAVAPSRLSPLLATTAAIGEGGALRISPARAAQLFLAQVNGGRVLALQNAANPGGASRLGPRRIQSLRFLPHDLSRIRFALGRTAESGTLSGLSRELAGMPAKSGGPLRVLAAKTGTATPYAKRYGSHGWLAMQVQSTSGAIRKQYVLVAFVQTGSGGSEARRLAMRALSLPGLSL